MKPHPDHLRRTGYRLPSESEWEYACRAGSEERGHYGSDPALLPRYGHFSGDSGYRAWPVGRKRPNDLGLFDAEGNVSTWCGEQVRAYPFRSSARRFLDEEDLTAVEGANCRAQRGSTFATPVGYARLSFRSSVTPSVRSFGSGLRVCRTLPPDVFP